VSIVALVVAVVAVPVLAIVLLGEDEDERTPRFEPLDPLPGPGVAEAGDEQDAFALGIGDCLLEPETEEFDTYIDLPCDEPHDLEVFHVVDHPAGEDEPYPGVDAMAEQADEVCVAAFADFVGLPWQDSTLDTYHIYPVEQGWDLLGDREIVCAVYDPAGPVEGTLEGAAR
jgi:hypothetical protein